MKKWSIEGVTVLTPEEHILSPVFSPSTSLKIIELVKYTLLSSSSPLSIVK